MVFEKILTANTVLGREIVAYRNVIGDSYVYLLAGVHGNEPEGVFVLEHLFEWLQEVKLSIPTIVIPILNIDGLDKSNRLNANNVDLNRNFPSTNWSPNYELDKYNPGASPLSEPENLFLVKLFERYTPKIIISFHSWKPILNINAKAREIAEHIAKFNDYVITEDIGYPTPGSLDSYVTEKYDCPVLTYECPELSSGLSLQEIWAENEHGLKDLFLTYL